MASQIVVLSGPPHAGKSVVAEALCARYDRMAHIDVTQLRGLIRMGRLRPWDETVDGRRQRELLISIACDIASRFVSAGYGVVVEDIVTPDDLSAYVASLRDCQAPVHALSLLPDLGIILGRERTRPTAWRHGGRLEALYQRLASEDLLPTIYPGPATPEEVADRVMQLAAGGSARLLREGGEGDREA